MIGTSEFSQKRLVYVVEPHPVAAEHLVGALRRNPALEVILSGVNHAPNVTLPKESIFLIVDADALPFPLSVYLHNVKAEHPDTQILVIGKRISDDDLCRMLFEGVGGFVSYDCIDAEICKAVDAVLRVGVYAAPAILQRYVRLSASLASRKLGEHGTFTPRENEVLGLLQRRLCDKEISSALGISERTVRFHLQNIFNKLGVHDRYQVIEWERSAGPTQEESITIVQPARKPEGVAKRVARKTAKRVQVPA